MKCLIIDISRHGSVDKRFDIDEDRSKQTRIEERIVKLTYKDLWRHNAKKTLKLQLQNIEFNDRRAEGYTENEKHFSNNVLNAADNK